VRAQPSSLCQLTACVIKLSQIPNPKTFHPQLDRAKIVAMAQDMARAIYYLHSRKPPVVRWGGGVEECVHRQRVGPGQG